jgi:hypothetical protein
MWLIVRENDAGQAWINSTTDQIIVQRQMRRRPLTMDDWKREHLQTWAYDADGHPKPVDIVPSCAVTQGVGTTSDGTCGTVQPGESQQTLKK